MVRTKKPKAPSEPKPRKAPKASKPAAAKAGIVSLKITLRGSKPPIWRRILVRGGMTLGELHRAIQEAMGWYGGHLHVFDVGGTEYGGRDRDDVFGFDDEVEDVADEKRMTVNAVIKSGVDKFTYTYDFGDDWEHVIAIEKKLPAVEVKSYPACVAGARACPREDCGGVWGYAELLEALADPAHPEHDEKIEWMGEHFDPEAFSVAAADARLAAAFDRK
jgi:hypothetical protein